MLPHVYQTLRHANILCLTSREAHICPPVVARPRLSGTATVCLCPCTVWRIALLESVELIWRRRRPVDVNGSPCCVFQRRFTSLSTGSQEETPCVARRYVVVAQQFVRVPCIPWLCWEGLVKLHGTPLSVGQNKKSLPPVVQCRWRWRW